MASASKSRASSIRFALSVDTQSLGVVAEGVEEDEGLKPRKVHDWRRKISGDWRHLSPGVALQRSRALLSSAQRNYSSASVQQMGKHNTFPFYLSFCFCYQNANTE